MRKRLSLIDKNVFQFFEGHMFWNVILFGRCNRFWCPSEHGEIFLGKWMSD